MYDWNYNAQAFALDPYNTVSIGREEVITNTVYHSVRDGEVIKTGADQYWNDKGPLPVQITENEVANAELGFPNTVAYDLNSLETDFNGTFNLGFEGTSLKPGTSAKLELNIEYYTSETFIGIVRFLDVDLLELFDLSSQVAISLAVGAHNSYRIMMIFTGRLVKEIKKIVKIKLRIKFRFTVTPESGETIGYTFNALVRSWAGVEWIYQVLQEQQCCLDCREKEKKRRDESDRLNRFLSSPHQGCLPSTAGTDSSEVGSPSDDVVSSDFELI